MKRIFDTQLIGPFAAMVIVALVVALTTERFLNPGNLSNLSLQVSIVALIAIGSTIVIFAAGIDLSSGSMVALLTMILAQVLKFDAKSQEWPHMPKWLSYESIYGLVQFRTLHERLHEIGDAQMNIIQSNARDTYACSCNATE